MKGIIQTILDKENEIDLSDEQQKGWGELFRIIAQIPKSKCHGYAVHLNSEGIICTYCGEPCEMIEEK